MGLYPKKTRIGKAQTGKHALQQYLQQPRHARKQNIHQQISGQRRTGIRLEWNSSLGKKLNSAVFRTADEPRNNHIRLSKSKGKTNILWYHLYMLS